MADFGGAVLSTPSNGAGGGTGAKAGERGGALSRELLNDDTGADAVSAARVASADSPKLVSADSCGALPLRRTRLTYSEGDDALGEGDARPPLHARAGSAEGGSAGDPSI